MGSSSAESEYVLGCLANEHDETAIVATLLWFSYRRGIVLSRTSSRGSTSDSGWGCTVRATQTLLSNALLRSWAHFARCSDEPTQMNCIRREVAKLFFDWPDQAHPFNLQAFLAETGGSRRWYGPHEAAHAMARMCARSAPILPSHIRPASNSFRVVVCNDTIISIPVIEQAAGWASSPRTDCSVLAIVPLKLGLHSMMPGYIADLVSLMRSRTFSGAIGGPTGHCVFIIGMADPSPSVTPLLVLDPHTTQDCPPPPTLASSRGSRSTSEEAIISEYMQTLQYPVQRRGVSHVEISSLDPTIALSFLFHCAEDFREFQCTVAVLEARRSRGSRSSAVVTSVGSSGPSCVPHDHGASTRTSATAAAAALPLFTVTSAASQERPPLHSRSSASETLNGSPRQCSRTQSLDDADGSSAAAAVSSKLEQPAESTARECAFSDTEEYTLHRGAPTAVGSKTTAAPSAHHHRHVSSQRDGIIQRARAAVRSIAQRMHLRRRSGGAAVAQLQRTPADLPSAAPEEGVAARDAAHADGWDLV